jgi:hypothetical protein
MHGRSNFHSGALNEAPPRPALQLVTRKGVVSSQLRVAGGKFGGKAPTLSEPQSFDEAIAAAQQQDNDDWRQQMRDHANRRAARQQRLERLTTIAAIVLMAFALLYFAGQYARLAF